ncbi:MAG: 30S ribosomal protein S16 [Candidatus Uhrbacteria bacterium]
MLSIRLSRIGKKRQPHYRVIVVDKRRDPWGKSIEILGSRNPRSKETVLKEERIKYWLDQGAQPSNTVWNMLIDAGIAQGEKRGVTHISKKRAGKQKEAVEAAKEKAAAAEAETKEEKPAEEVVAETPVEAPVEVPVETPAEGPDQSGGAEEVKEEVKE